MVKSMNNAVIYEIQEIAQKLEPIFKSHGVKSAVLFGSYAKGVADENSDIDIIIDSGLRGLDFVGLIEYVREALNKEIDMIDTHYMKKGSRIEREAYETGVLIYGR